MKRHIRLSQVVTLRTRLTGTGFFKFFWLFHLLLQPIAFNPDRRLECNNIARVAIIVNILVTKRKQCLTLECPSCFSSMEHHNDRNNNFWTCFFHFFYLKEWYWERPHLPFEISISSASSSFQRNFNDFNECSVYSVYSIVPPVQIFKANTCHATPCHTTYTETGHPLSIGKKELPFRQVHPKNRYFVEWTPERMLLHSL